MAGKILNIEELLDPDQLACQVSNYFIEWETYRRAKVQEWQEVQQYIFATDTTKTSNAKLPWSNKTTLPKLCQIRDNLSANYLAAMFPRKKWMSWEGEGLEDESPDKKESIESYMTWAVERNEFYDEAVKLVNDFIDYGNCFGTVEWYDGRVERKDKIQSGYCGPLIRRISPLDILFNPTAPSFSVSPKIVRSLVSLGEVKEMLERMSHDEKEKEDAKALYDYLMGVRRTMTEYVGDTYVKDQIYNISGFGGYREYLESNYCEILTFYGDIFNEDSGEFQRNQVIKVVDRNKILSQYDNPSFFGSAPIWHAGWRIRPDNLWAMGPLDNLVGMQYRIDHLENMKADVFDLIAYPPIMIKGYAEDFNWGPMERIYVSEEGEVELKSPDVAALQADNQIAILQMQMEEMAGSPKEAMGFRTPGEKTKFEVQQLQNAAGRIFQNKIAQFERQMLENLLNGMLELARRNLNEQTIRIFSTEEKVADFMTLTQDDITGYGRLKPMAARHFAEKAQQVQDLANFRSSVAGQDPALLMHFSTVAEARLWEDLLEIQDYKIVEPYIRLSEAREAQTLQNVNEEQMTMDTLTPSGLSEDDQTMGGPLQ